MTWRSFQRDRFSESARHFVAHGTLACSCSEKTVGGVQISSLFSSSVGSTDVYIYTLCTQCKGNDLIPRLMSKKVRDFSGNPRRA